MISRKGVGALVAGVVSLALLAAACSTAPTPDGDGTNGPLATSDALAASRLASAYGGGQTGLHVFGVGSVTAEPDLGILNMGVEATEDTVEDARNVAAQAMNAVRAALAGVGVSDDDIETRFFSIQPEYVWREVYEGDRIQSMQELVGYRVSNNVEVKIRDLERAGEVVDAVALAGGDVIRVNNISFTVEDPLPFEMQARELAVKEARAKAEQMAGWAGESLGNLVFLSESSTPSPVRRLEAYAESSADAAFALPSTSIAPGDMEVRVTVQAVWTIE